VKHAVLNASPVIVLARAGYLDLVPKLVALDIPVVGTLGLLLAARQSRLLPSLQAAVDRVKSCGLFVDDAVAWRIISMGKKGALRVSAWRSR